MSEKVQRSFVVLAGSCLWAADCRTASIMRNL